jgi:type IV secretion system protein VirB2
MFNGKFPAIALASYMFLIFTAFMGISDAAFASTAGPGGGAGLQWENPIQMIVRSISGPVAYGFGVLALIGFAVAYAYGEDLSNALKKLLNIVIGISILMFAVPLLGIMFVGAVIP